MSSTRRNLLLPLFLFVLFGFQGVLYSQAKKTIRSLDVTGQIKISKAQILNLIKTKKGGVFDASTWTADKLRLQKTGWFSRVTMLDPEATTLKYVRLDISLEEKEFDLNVKSIEIKGLKDIKKEHILALLTTAVGKEFDKNIYDQDLKRLYDQGFSFDIKPSVVIKATGVEIVIELAEDRDWFDDYKVKSYGGSSGSLKKHLKEQVFRRPNGFYMDDGEISTIKTRIQEFYKEKSYFFAKVQTSTVLERGLKKIIFTVTRGPKLRVAGLEYIGNKRYTQKQLIKSAQVGVRPRDKYISKTKFKQSSFAEDPVKLIQYYSKNGYIDVKITVEPFEYNVSKDRVYIKMNIDEGPRYVISKIKFKGNELFTDEDILSVLENFPGSPYYPRAIFLNDSKAITDLYGNEGRLFTLVRPVVKIDADRHLAEITYEIKEKGKITVGRIHIRGNDVTKENVILRQLELFPGDEYDAHKFNLSKRNLGRLPFLSADPRKFKFEMIPSGDNTGDLIIEVEEADSGSLQFGAAFNDLDSLVGTLSISERNFNWMSLIGLGHFKGGGQTLSMSGAVGVKSQRYSLSFSNPKIFDQQISFSVSSYSRQRIYSEYDEGRLGGGFGFSKQILGDLWSSFRYRIEGITIDNIDSNAPQVIIDEEGDYTVSALTFSLRYDKRNNFGFPTSGYFVSLSETIGEAVAFGEKEFTQTKFEFKGYLPVYYRVDPDTKKRYPFFFSTRFEVASNFSYNDSVVPLSDRFFAGGPTSVRGFGSNELGPRDNGEIFPGNFRVLGGLEFNIPLVDQMIYLAFFADTGYVWEDPQDFELDEMRLSTGVTLRVRIPQLSNQPISLNYAFPLIDKEGDDIERFSFNFVTAF